VGVGLLAAGTAAYVIARRRMWATEEAPLELPLESANGGPRELTEQASAMLEHVARPVGAAGTLRDTSADADRPADATLLAPDTATDEQRAETGAAATLPDGAPTGVVDAEAAPFVGNIRTLAYHRSDDENLPDEENRTYFASAEEAEGAGYHLDRNEVAGAGSE
jgi:hypothetical protein